MKMSVVTACAVASLCVLASAGKSQAQSKEDLLARLEAKIDALSKEAAKRDALTKELSKENASLRDRVRRIETSRPLAAAPPRQAAVSPSAAPAPASASVLSEPVRAAQAAAYAVKAAAMSDCPAARFQGGYVGVHGGSTSYTANRADLDGYLLFPAPVTVTAVAKSWGGVVGGQAGYNWSRCNALFGIELDGSWTSAEASMRVVNTPGIGTNVIADVTSRLHGIGTARGRAGVVVDNLLLYLTGGIAVARTETTWTSNFLGIVIPPEALSSNTWRYGWVGGFGAEWALTDRLSVRSEALYIDLVDRNYTLDSPILSPVVGQQFNFKNSDSIWSARVGMSYKLWD